MNLGIQSTWPLVFGFARVYQITNYKGLRSKTEGQKPKISIQHLA